MAIFPGAVWRGNCRNNGPGPRPSVTKGMVLHVNDGPDVSLWSWVNSPTSNMSCHFQVRVDGTVEQYLDTDLISWCQAGGNREWLSMEMPTHPDTGMSKAQIAAGGRVLAWAARLYGFPLRVTNDPNVPGLGWHGMNIPAWGSHPGCPGLIRRGQMQDLINAALAGGTTPEDDYDMPGYSSWSDADKAAFWADGTKAIITRPLAGYKSPETVGEALVNASLAGRSASVALNDTDSGLLVQVARLQTALAGLPDAVAAKVGAGSGGSVDAAAIAKEAVREALAELGAELTASNGAHAA